MHISRQAIPEFNGGNTLDKREATDPKGKFQQADEQENQPREGRSRTEGNARPRNNQEYRTTHAAGS